MEPPPWRAATVWPVTVLVDEAVWPWRGRCWAHLVSDESYEELHEAARRVGKRRLGFQGDHYDVDEADRERAVDDGAVVVESRELVRRLRAAGLRRSGAKPSWLRVAEWPSGAVVDDVVSVLGSHGDAGRRLAAGLATFDGQLSDFGVVLFSDSLRLAALLELDPWVASVSMPRIDAGTVPTIDEVVVGGARAGGDRSIELFVTK